MRPCWRRRGWRQEGPVLTEGVLLVFDPAVDQTAAGQDDARLDAGPNDGFEEVDRANHVHSERGRRLFPGYGLERLAGQVDDGVGPDRFEEVVHEAGLVEVSGALAETAVPWRLLDVAEAAADAHQLPIRGGQEMLDQVAPHEAGGAGDEEFQMVRVGRSPRAVAQGQVLSAGILGTASKMTSFSLALFAFRMRMMSSAVTGSSSTPSMPTS